MKTLLAIRFCLTLLTLFAVTAATAAEPQLTLKKGDKIVLIGNTLAERMQYFNHWETLLHARFPEDHLVVRNLGWSADELTLRPRSQDFQDHGHRLEDHKPQVILAMFGFNESFGGTAKLEKFRKDLRDFVKQNTTTKYDGENPPQLVLISPIAHEDLHNPNLPDGEANNENIAMYTAAMKEIAAEAKVGFVDLFKPTKQLFAGSNAADKVREYVESIFKEYDKDGSGALEASEWKGMRGDPAVSDTNDDKKLTVQELTVAFGGGKKSLTFNGVHLSDAGYRKLAPILDEALFGSPLEKNFDYEKLRSEIAEKNLQFWYDYRAVNGFYIYGGRKAPFGIVNFPAEFAKLRKMIANRDQRVWDVAAGKSVPDKIDDSQTGEFAKIETNVDPGKIVITTPEESQKALQLADGYQVNLFASEVEFPDLENPVSFCFDAKGRLWVTTMPTYPQYLPGTPVSDKILIFEDTDGDGKADKRTVFADGLHVPTGIELGHGGCYVAQQPNLMFLKDTDGDDKADVREIVLHGFDSADSHHSISAFTWGPEGGLYFQEGTFHHSQIETPYGPQRLKDAGVFRYDPRRENVEIFVSYPFANPWGHTFDDWGQNLVADASGGANYFGTAFSGDSVYPNKKGNLKQFLVKQWRPTSGCELVSSRQFPEEAQGNYLLNNCIGFHGVLQYKMRDDGSGFAADPVQPLLQSSDTDFRPVALQFGPDGALYVVDWFNPLIGHMQHSLRDPNRDKTHGRIWRITYTKNDLLKAPKIDGASLAELFDVLKSYEYRTRYRARQEIGARDTQEVIPALQKWLAGLDKTDENYAHHLLEALWVMQNHNSVDKAFLEQMLQHEDYRVRAAATRVLVYSRHEFADALDLLLVQAGDEHPRVRLEAVRGASFFSGDKAREVADETLLSDQDDYLKYTYGETIRTLDQKDKAK